MSLVRAIQIGILCGLIVPVALAQSDEEREHDMANTGLDHVMRISESARALGEWEDQASMIERAINRMWEENKWESEADQFAKGMALEVSSIPPWEVDQRYETFVGAVRERYHFTDQQTALFESRLLFHAGKMAFKNAGTMYRQTQEVVRTRLSGQPFTPDQIAKWTQESSELLQDARGEFESLAGAMAKTFTPEQREIYERDMESFHRRVEASNQLRARWAKGEWKPEDWGLDGDPVQSGQITPAERAEMGKKLRDFNRNPRPQPQRPPVTAYDETSWERYVREFIELYELDEGQADAALSILREVQLRAESYRMRHREELAQVFTVARQTSRAYQPVRDLFEEMKRRLYPIPTDNQRRRADEKKKERADRGQPVLVD